MFFAETMTARAWFCDAATRLPTVINERMLRTALAAAYRDGITEVMQAGAAGPAPALPHLTAMHLLQPARDDVTITVAIRWVAVDKDGDMLPVLDADLTMTRDGDTRIRLRLAGSFRPPPGDGRRPGTPLSRRFTAAAVRSLLSRLTSAVTGAAPEQPATGCDLAAPAGGPPGRLRRLRAPATGLGRPAALSPRPAVCRFRAGTRGWPGSAASRR